jgi:glycosyltransferase involved in cell wall biosynthesis
MEVIFLINTLGSGGAQRQVVQIATELQRLDIKVTLICFFSRHNFFAKSLEKQNVEIVYLDKNYKSPNHIITLWELYKCLKRQKGAILLPFLFKANLSCIVLKIFMGIRNKIICSERSNNYAYNSWKLRFFRIIYFILSDKIVCNSHAASNEIKKKYFIRNSKVITIWNGYNLPEILPKIKLKEKKYEFIYVGRIIPSKNLHVIINCMDALFQNTDIKIHLNVLGRVEKGHENYFYAIKAKVDASEVLTSNISFRGEVENTSDFYKKSGVLVLLSEFEGLPNVVCEALAHGCLVVSSNISDMDIMVGEDRGFILNEISEKALYETIVSYNKLSKLTIQKMRNSAINFSNTNLSIENVAETYLCLLNEVSQ